MLERYRLHRRLGTGAFGTVWLAHDERLDRDVAVKVLARERVVGGRFEREARAAARLSHPAIVTLYEAAVDDEGAYLVSELVHGDTLGSLVAEGRLSDRDVVAIGIALCDALEHAHRQGIVHRDVKPSNILVPEAPANVAGVAKLTDFGVARLAGGEALTETGDVIGTLAYMAPEQAEGLEAGAPADLYSLALVIYEALCGVNPLAQTRATARAGSRRLGTYLPPLRRQRRDLPRELAQAIDGALRPRPRERGTLADLRRALTQSEPRISDEPGVVTGAWTPLRRTGEHEHAANPWSPSLGAPAALDDAGGGTAEHPADRSANHPAPGAADHPAAHEAAPPTPPWLARGAAAATTAALVAWLTAAVLAPLPVPPAAAALVAGTAVLVVPRVAWLALTLALMAVMVAQGDPGTALIVVVALALPVVLLPLSPTAWPLAAAAPALGLIGIAGLAGAWPALAGRATAAWRRAALGALGWIWLLLAAPLAGRALYLRPATGHAGAAATAIAVNAAGASPGRVAHHLLLPLLHSGAAAPALVWAAAALVTPWLVRRRSPALDLLRAAAWATLTVLGTRAAIVAVTGADPAGAIPGAAVGAVAGAVLTLAPALSAPRRVAGRRGSSSPRVP